MRLVNNYDTGIEDLIEKANEETIFLSDWNKSDTILNFSDSIIDAAADKYRTYKNFYVFSDELQEVKKEFEECFSDGTYKVNGTNYAIVSNGTSASFLALHAIQKKLGHIRALMISPVYFTYIRVLQDFKADMFYLEADMKKEEFLPMEAIEKEIKENDINLLIVNDPLFGSGISLSLNQYQHLGEICKKYNSYFYIDYIYGGMEWLQKAELQNYALIKYVVQNEHIVMTESLCKRIFLNGIKSGIVFANAEIIDDLEKTATSITGSMTYVQLEMFKELHKKENEQTIKDLIAETRRYCSETYQQLKTMLDGTKFDLLPCKSGNFCMMGVPKASLKLSGNEAAAEIIEETNVLVLPHDRYLISSDEFFYFRVNLAVERNIIQEGVQKLLLKYGK